MDNRPHNFMQKAKIAISSAHNLYATGDYDGACNRAYYSMFDAARAAIYNIFPDDSAGDGKTHRGLIKSFSTLMVVSCILPKDFGRYISQVESIRSKSDYSECITTKNDADNVLKIADEFVMGISEMNEQTETFLRRANSELQKNIKHHYHKKNNEGLDKYESTYYELLCDLSNKIEKRLNQEPGLK